MKKLFQELTIVYRRLAEEVCRYVTKKYKVSAVILFGSLVKGKIRSDLVKEPSDIDILIITEKKDIKRIKSDLIGFMNEKILMKYGIVAYPVVLSLKEYIKGLEKDQFIINVHAYGEILYGEKPRKFS